MDGRALVFVAYSAGFGRYAMFRRRLARLLARLDGPRLVYSTDPRGFVVRCAGEAGWVAGAAEVAEEDLGRAGLTHAVIFDDGESCARLAAAVESMGLSVRRVPVDIARVVNVDRGQECDVYIGRGSEWGNPYALGFDGDREEVLRKFRYECERAVLLLDGEELVGAKQNRILNLTVLAPAGKATVIPVSCVEAGRWNHESAEFRSSAQAHYSSGRARKAAQVSDSLRASGSRRSNQGAVWDDIALKSGRMGAESGTGAAAAMYEAHRVSLEAFVEAIACRERQVGAVFTINGAVIGLDLFDNPATYARQAAKLVRSYALDAIDARGEEDRSTEETVSDFLAEIAASRQDRFPAVGVGEDVRLNGTRLTGAALEAMGRVVHLCAFRLTGESGRTRSSRGTRMVSASRRRGGIGLG